MDELFDPSNDLLCDEVSKDLFFNDPSDNGDDKKESEESNDLADQNDDDDDLDSMLARETEFLPNHDYLNRLRSGDLDFSLRNEAFDWIFKAHSYYSFGPLCLCLAVNYLDRFYSSRQLPSDKAWTVQLLAVACLSIAAKVEETCVPLSFELQVGDPKYVFEAKTIQRMELFVLDALNWKMNAVTPCSFLNYSFKKLIDPNSLTDKFLFSTAKVVNRSVQLILDTIKGIDYLEYRPSEIAAAAAVSVSAEIQAVDIEKATSCFTHLAKGRVVKCIEMIKKMSQIRLNGFGLVVNAMQQGVPQSPIAVLDARCFSNKSVVASCSNSSLMNTTTTTLTAARETKRIKLEPTSTLDDA